MSEPAWLTVARSYLGTAEIPGKATAPVIRRWLIALKAWWTDDETPWCGTFVAAAMREAGIALPEHWYRAKGWLEWGHPAPVPALGAVVIYERQGGGHVGFVVGTDPQGRILTLGGNQGNRVSIAAFDPSRVLGYRLPTGYGDSTPTPVLASTGASSRNEA